MQNKPNYHWAGRTEHHVSSVQAAAATRSLTAAAGLGDCTHVPDFQAPKCIREDKPQAQRRHLHSTYLTKDGKKTDI